MTVRLIVNADDYGHTPSCSAGIRRAHLEGIVTTTTTMMNCYDAVPALRIAREETPELGVGVHLVLTHGAPLLPPERVPTLVRRDGQFFELAELPQAMRSVDVGQLRDEWRAQIEAFLETGTTIDHLDSHHHVSFLFDKALPIVYDFASEYNVPIRNPLAGYEAFKASPGFVDVANDGRRLALNLMETSPVRYPDTVVLHFYNKGISLDNLLDIIDTLPDGTAEIMCHPAIVDDELMQITTYHTMRGVELDLLTDARVIDRVQGRGIELVTFADL
jgi:chitin disaccharide deacetylase